VERGDFPPQNDGGGSAHAANPDSEENDLERCVYDNVRVPAAVQSSTRDVGKCCEESCRWSTRTSSSRLARTAPARATATQGSAR